MGLAIEREDFVEDDYVRFDERLPGTSGEREIPGLEGVFWGISYGITFRLLAVG